MIITPDFQIIKSRDRKYDILLRKPYLERSESELVTCYYLLQNLEAFCFFVLGVEIMPHQSIILRTLLRKPYVMMILSRGGSKSFILGVYAALRTIITSGSKIVIVGANRRQSLFVFNEVSKIYHSKNAGLFRDCCVKPPTFQPEESYLMIKGMDRMSKISSLPLASGDRIRGLRSTHMLVDEANIVPEDIHKTVLSPMGAVSADNVENYKRYLREQELIKAGIIIEKQSIEMSSNQMVMSSSAGYQFQFLYKEYKSYRAAILESIKNNKSSPYAIIQMGWEAVNLLAPSYLDVASIEKDKKTFSFDRFDMEYNANFVSDSAGFYPRSLLEKRTVPRNSLPSVEVESDNESAYILAIDPSSADNIENDFFGIAVGKIDLVTKKMCLVNASGSTGQGWIYHVNLVKEYIKRFKPQYIVLDRFGGGLNLADTLKSDEYMKKDEGNRPIFQLEKDDLNTYNFAANQILRLVTFEPIWIENANFNFKAMLDHENFIFASPPLESTYYLGEKIVDQYEDAQEGIEECKNELCLIVGEPNSNGRITFKLPESLGQVKKTRRVRKDMYTACLLLSWGYKEFFEMRDKKQGENIVEYTPHIGLV